MSYIIKIPGADFSNSGLPKLREQARGFDKAGLVGLFLFEEGNVGDVVSGPWADSSGSGHQLTLYANRQAPTRRSYGIDVNSVNGVILQSDIPSSLTEFTVIAGLRNNLPGSEASVYYHWFGATDNAYPADPSASHSSNAYPSPNFDARVAAGDYAIYAADANIFGSNRAMRLLPSDGATIGDAIAISYRIDGPGQQGAHSTLSGLLQKVTDADITTKFNGSQTGFYTFGWWPFGTARTAQTVPAQLYGFAIYNRYLSDSETVDNLRAMAAIAASRGVTLNGA